MNKYEKLREWMFPAVLILFILQVILLPVMIGLTYATRSERPEHILTYTTGRLVWDKDTSVRPDGSAALSFFESLYQNVNAENIEKVLAPGTEKDSIVRLKNNSKNSSEKNNENKGCSKGRFPYRRTGSVSVQYGNAL